MDVTLLVVAAPVEARAVLLGAGGDVRLATRDWRRHHVRDGVELIITGVGKVNAAAAVARLADAAIHRRIINLGIAGALPESGLAIGAAIAATESIYADEGLLTPDGFLDCAQMGFAPGAFEGGFEGSAVGADPRVLEVLGGLADRTGPIATVSTCSGMNALAAQVRERTGALAECMEGAAVAHTARRLGIPSGELRIISNTTGDRKSQQWDLSTALARLSRVTGQLLEADWPVRAG